MIGVFDSGVGGLAVLTEIRAALPDADLVYVADRARAPYGTRSLQEVEEISLEIGRWLFDNGAETVVVACNTASAAALETLRATFPEHPIVGMEPAVKPAAALSKSRTVGVFATSATFQGRLFASVISRFASGVEVIERACPEWVEMVESGVVSGPEAQQMVSDAVTPVVEAGADVIVLGCTHFSFLRPLIEEISGVEVIDPAPAVGRQTARVAASVGGSGELVVAGSGDLDRLASLASHLAGIETKPIPFP